MVQRTKRHDSGEITRPISDDELRVALEVATRHAPEDRPTRPDGFEADDLLEIQWVALAEPIG